MIAILLPTDFSDNSWNAIKYALELYKDQKCTFHILNTYTPIVYNIEYVLVAPAQFGLGDPIRYASQENLGKLVERISEASKPNPNHSFETMARFDTLVSGVRELVEERDIDLIVMGTQGATGAKEVLFGSNTVQIFKNIKCPILAIPSQFNYEAPHDILFPTDLEINYENVNLDVLAALVKSHNSKVSVLHVSVDDKLSDEKTNNYNHLQSLFDGSAYLFHKFRSTDIPDAINKFQIKHKINLLAMVNNKHSIFENLFFKNTVNQIGLNLNIPFLVIPTNKNKEL